MQPPELSEKPNKFIPRVKFAAALSRVVSGFPKVVFSAHRSGSHDESFWSKISGNDLHRLHQLRRFLPGRVRGCFRVRV